MALRRQKHNTRFFFLRSQPAQRKRIWPNDQSFNSTVQAYTLTKFEFSDMHWSARRFDPDPGPEGQKLPTKMEKSRNWKSRFGYAVVVIFGLHPHTPTIKNAVLRIRITLMRIRILLSLKCGRILLFTLMRSCGSGPESYLSLWCGSGSRSYLSIWCGSWSFHSLFYRFVPSNVPKWPSKASTFSRSFGSRSCFYFDAEAGPDPGFHFDAFPDPAFHNDEDPDPQHCKNVSSPFRSSRTYKYIWMSLPSPPVEE